VLEKDEEDQLEQLYEKRKSIMQSQIEVLHRRNRRKANWIVHILHRSCPLKHVVEGKAEERLEVTGR
jgi:shikimate kinase